MAKSAEILYERVSECVIGDVSDEISIGVGKFGKTNCRVQHGAPIE